MKSRVSNILISFAWLETHYIKDTFSLLQENQGFFIALTLNVVISGVNQLIEHNWDLFLIYFYLLVVVLIERIAFLWNIFIRSISRFLIYAAWV